MAIIPLWAASDGLLVNLTPLEIGVRGLLLLEDTPTPPNKKFPLIEIGAGGSNNGKRKKTVIIQDNGLTPEEIRRMYIEEDEILLLIKIFLKCQ